MKKRVDHRNLVQMTFRSLLVQGSWNYKSLLGLGFCYSILPVMRRLFKSDPDQRAFIQRHLGFFNAHPYFASWCLGAVAKLEEEALWKKGTDYRPIAIFKERLAGPLGAIGDELFWNGIKPAAAGLSVWIAVAFDWIAVPILLVAYNLPHLYIRFRGMRDGYQAGFDIVSVLSLRRFQNVINIVKVVGALSAGLCLAAGVDWVWEEQREAVGIFLLSVVVTVLFLRLKRSITTVLLAAVLIAAAFGLLFK
jgi:mannose/fructose/N-acetylgalactosamine-specific phosphotransferase system component IID